MDKKQLHLINRDRTIARPWSDTAWSNRYRYGYQMTQDHCTHRRGCALHLKIQFVLQEDLVEWHFLCLFLFEHKTKRCKVLSIYVSVNELNENRQYFYKLEGGPQARKCCVQPASALEDGIRIQNYAGKLENWPKHLKSNPIKTNARLYYQEETIN